MNGSILQDAYRYTSHGAMVARLQLLVSPGLQACAAYRLAHGFHVRGLWAAALIVWRLGYQLSGADICPSASIGRGLRLPHPCGVVVGAGVQIDEECTLYAGVTLGVAHPDQPDEPYPTLGDRVVVGAGAKVLGGVQIGDDARIGANAVVLHSAPAGSVAVGVPARVLRTDGHG